MASVMTDVMTDTDERGAEGGGPPGHQEPRETAEVQGSAREGAGGVAPS